MRGIGVKEGCVRDRGCSCRTDREEGGGLRAGEKGGTEDR